jgi:hypothetical protein
LQDDIMDFAALLEGRHAAIARRCDPICLDLPKVL